MQKYFKGFRDFMRGQLEGIFDKKSNDSFYIPQRPFEIFICAVKYRFFSSIKIIHHPILIDSPLILFRISNSHFQDYSIKFLTIFHSEL